MAFQIPVKYVPPTEKELDDLIDQRPLLVKMDLSMFPCTEIIKEHTILVDSKLLHFSSDFWWIMDPSISMKTAFSFPEYCKNMKEIVNN